MNFRAAKRPPWWCPLRKPLPAWLLAVLEELAPAAAALEVEALPLPELALPPEPELLPEPEVLPELVLVPPALPALSETVNFVQSS